MQFSSHARSFIGTTILAIFISIVLIILAGITIYVLGGPLASIFRPQWEGSAPRPVGGNCSAGLLQFRPSWRSAVSSSSFETSAKSAEYHIFQFDRASELLVRSYSRSAGS